MKRFGVLSVLVLLVSLFAAPAGHAQGWSPYYGGEPPYGTQPPPPYGAPQGAPDRFELTLTPMSVVTLGDWNEFADSGIGGTVGLRYRFFPTISLTARAGFVYYFPALDGLDTTTVPLLVGLQWDCNPRIFLTAEVGASLNSWRVKDGGSRLSDSRWGRTAAFGLGYRIGSTAIVYNVMADDWGDFGYGVDWAMSIGWQFSLTTF